MLLKGALKMRTLNPVGDNNKQMYCVNCKKKVCIFQ